MKKLFLSLSIIIAAASLVACSKDKGNNNANPYGNGYANGQGQYGTTPNDPRCAGGGYAGYPYQQYQQQGGYYPGQMPGNVNCIPQGTIYGGNPYYVQMNYQMYLGTCDLRFSGRGQLCPPGYMCQPAYGSMGVCMRGY